MSHREHLLWLDWLERRGRRPDLYCWYLMQVAAEIRLIRHALSKDPPPVRLADLELKFETRERADEPGGPEPKAVEALFLARMGLVGRAKAAALARGRGEAPGAQAGKGKGKGRPLILPPARPANPPRPDARTWEELDARRRRLKGG